MTLRANDEKSRLMRKLIDEKGELGFDHVWMYGWTMLAVKLYNDLFFYFIHQLVMGCINQPLIFGPIPGWVPLKQDWYDDRHNFKK